MLTALQCLAKAIEMDAKAAVFDRAEYRAEYAALATGWRDLAAIARQQDRFAAALESN
jgi:hypothetical protein